MTAFRGSRSAITPPTRMKTSCGTDRAARTRPRSVARAGQVEHGEREGDRAPSRSRRTDTARPPKSRRNWRWASGPSRPAAGSCPSTASSRRRTARAGRRAPSGRPRPRRPPPRGRLAGRGDPRVLVEPLARHVAQRVELARAASARCSDGDVGDAEVGSARRSGWRRSISSNVRNQPSTSMSGGGDGGSTTWRPAGCGRRRRRPRRASRRRGGSRRGATRGPGEGKQSSPRTRSPTTSTFSCGHRRELAPEHVERVAVEPARARLEPARVDDVRRADLGDVHRSPGCSRTSVPAAPAWSRWMCERSRWRTSVSASPRSASAAFSASGCRSRPAVVEGGPVVGLEQVARRRRARSGGGGRSGRAGHV